MTACPSGASSSGSSASFISACRVLAATRLILDGGVRPFLLRAFTQVDDICIDRTLQAMRVFLPIVSDKVGVIDFTHILSR